MGNCRCRIIRRTQGLLAMSLVVGALGSCSHGSTSASTPTTSISDLQAPVPDRFAQSLLGSALSTTSNYFTTSGSFGSGAALNSYLNTNVPSERSISGPAVAENEVTLVTSADGKVVVLGDRSTTGRCWFIEMNNEPQAVSGGIPGVSSVLGKSYNQIGITRGGNASCGVAMGPAGTGQNVPAGWVPNGFPLPAS
jgi:hypothetical protein